MWGIEEIRKGLQGTFKEKKGFVFIRHRTCHTSHVPDDKEQRHVKTVGKRVAGERRKKFDKWDVCTFAPKFW